MLSITWGGLQGREVDATEEWNWRRAMELSRIYRLCSFMENDIEWAKKQMHFCVKRVRKDILGILHDKDVRSTDKIRLLLFSCFPKLYCVVFNIYEKG